MIANWAKEVKEEDRSVYIANPPVPHVSETAQKEEERAQEEHKRAQAELPSREESMKSIKDSLARFWTG